MMARRWIASFLLFPLMAMGGCGRGEVGSTPPNPNVVASFRGGEITKEQLEAKFDGLMPCCQPRYHGVEGRKTLIKEMVMPTVIAETIKKKKIDLRESIREKMGNLTSELNMSFLHMKFHEQILDSSEKYRDLKESYEYQKKRLEGVTLAERYGRLVQIHQEVHPKIAREVEAVAKDYLQKLRKEASIVKNYDSLKFQVTEGELKDFYQKIRQDLGSDQYRVPERIKVEEIRIKVDKAQQECPTCPKDKVAREKGEAALVELRSGADFREVARRYSSDPRPEEPRWIDRGRRGGTFDESAFSLEVGRLSQLLRSGDSFYLVRVLEKQPARFKPYGEIRDALEKEYRWKKGEKYLQENGDRILFTINGKPYSIGDFIRAYTQKEPPHECHHQEGTRKKSTKDHPPRLCDFAHNDFEEQKEIVDRMIDRELAVEDTYNQMIHVEHKKEIEFLTLASLYPLFHREEMEGLIRIDDQKVKDYYGSHKQNYQYPAKAKIRMILIKGGEKAEDKKKAYQKAIQAYRELKPSFFSFQSKKDFALVAKIYSEDPATVSRGGLLEVDVYECRNAVEYMLFHGFHKEVFALKPGDISEVFQFGGDYYLIKIEELKSREEIPFSEVKEAVKKDLVSKEHEKIMEKWEADLLKSAGLVVYEKALREMPLESPVGGKKPGGKGEHGDHPA